MALCISAEGSWIRADFLYEIRWQEEHSNFKTSLVNLYLELKAHVLVPFEVIMNNVK